MEDKSQVIKHFKEYVNMTSKELANWLNTDESKTVGQKLPNDEESIGHHSGVRILELLNKQEEQYTAQDLQHMQKVYSYIKRHLAQKPNKNIATSRWCYSLRNWGHDTLKDRG